MKKSVVAVFVATIWISLSEFVRNELLFNHFWTDHYNSLGIAFPAEPVNGAIWGLWSLLFAIGILILKRRFNSYETFGIAWFFGFVLMWVVTGNMGVLPFGILIYAIPLSLLETYVAVLIIGRLTQ
jgi:hypothetical protein